MSKKPFLRPSLLRVSIATAIGSMALSGAPITSVYAQDTAEEIVVTGSRIIRRDFESNSPIVTVDADDFETQTGLNVESYLNQLPEYNPAAAPTTTQGDVQITPVNSVGIASISLRGFGANRSLVLVDGKRPVPINALMVTDVNSIPSALIERVETITGGASAVYGADAVGGVTNFILRDDFEGLELDSQYGTSEAGDGDEYRMSAVLGANFADGRGNVTMGVESYTRKEALERERDIFTDRWSNPLAAGGLFLQGVNNYSCNDNCADQATVNALFGGQSPFSPTSFNVFRTYNFNPDGSIFVSGSALGLSKYTGPVDGQIYARRLGLDSTDTSGETIYESLKWNNTQALASAPQDRYSFFASGNFDLTDNVSVFSRATFAESKTETLLFGTNAIGGWEALIPYDPNIDSPVDPNLDYTDMAAVQALLANPDAYANPNFIPTGADGAHFPVPLEMAVLLNARPNQAGVWQPGWNPDFSLPPRSTTNTNEVWQLEAGINFELPFRDWTGEAYVSHGESSTYNVAAGNLSLARYRTLINQPDYGRNAEGTGNIRYVVGQDPVTGEDIIYDSIRPAFGAGDYTCGSGFYDTLFSGDQPLSDDCFRAVSANLQTRTENTQDIMELNLQGSLFELPAGEVRAAVGYQKRRNTAKFNPDILQSQDSFTDQVVGVYPTGYLDASTSVDDYYVETLVPVIADVPGIQMLELELGARFSDYRETDEETTWKALANWQVNDWARFRGGFNRATRAPNIGELFLNQQEIFTGGGDFSDACGIRSNAPYGMQGAVIDGQLIDDPIVDPNEQPIALAPGQTQEGANSTYLICEALMGGQGSEAATRFYEVNDATAGGGGGFAWVLQEGNPNLRSEVADTWTFGFVLNSPFDGPWLSGLTASFDYYNVEIEDAIMLSSIDQGNNRCFGNIVSSREEAAAWAQSDACQLLPRNQADGAALTTKISYDNQATIETSGMDIGLNWFGDMQELFGMQGGLSLSLNATVLNKYETRESAANFDVLTDWKGSLGPNLSGTNGGAYDFRIFGSLGYFRDNWGVSLRWRYLPEVWTAGYASQQAIIENNGRVAAGGDGIILGYTPSTEKQTNDYHIADLSFNWDMTETVTLRGGITNLFDTRPPRVGDTEGRLPGSNLDICGGAPGCINPGGYSLPSYGSYNGGYYDTLGRRFFLGLKATF